MLIIIAFLYWCSNWQQWWNLTEKELEDFFRKNTINNNYAVAIKLSFTNPTPWTAYLWTIHGYPDNKSVCEELISPYNEDPSLTIIPGSIYYCETLNNI